MAFLCRSAAVYTHLRLPRGKRFISRVIKDVNIITAPVIIRKYGGISISADIHHDLVLLGQIIND